MFCSRIRRVWGHAAIFAWSDLILDNSRELVGLQLPAACCLRSACVWQLGNGNSGPNIENCSLFHAQSPNTGRGVHARSWFVAGEGSVREHALRNALCLCKPEPGVFYWQFTY